MRNPLTRRLARRALVATCLMAIGCDPEPDSLRPLANDLIQKQAAQQESLVRQSEHLSDASRQLVESDAQSRRELVEFQSTLETQIEEERREIDRQRDGLEQERRDIAAQRHRDPLIAAALIQTATLIVAALPILLVVFLVRAARHEPSDVTMGELLVGELSADRSLILEPPASVRLSHESDSPVGPDDRADEPID